MDLTGKSVWQIAAGDSTHHYANACIGSAVIIMGPGGEGPWPDCKEPLKAEGWTDRKLGILEKFCETVAEGDIVVLHVGMKVFGVGEVTGGYKFDKRFATIQDWDLQHTRPVKWLWIAYDKPKVFPPKTLGWGDTVKPLKSDVVKAWLEELNTEVATPV